MLGVCICTHNRPGQLADCLDALLPQLRGRDTRVLVVDSGSDVSSRAANVTIANRDGVEFKALATTGLSIARNYAVRHFSDCEWIAFLDDDAIPSRQWLAGLSDQISELGEDYGVVAGRVDPLWPGPAPKIDPIWAQFLSLVQCANDVDCPVPFRFAGTNLAVRREAVAAAGGFPTDLDRNGRDLLSGGDSFVVMKLIANGYKYRYSNAFPVLHQIAPERLQPDWMTRRALAEGRTEGILMSKRGGMAAFWNTVKVAAGVARYSLESALAPEETSAYWKYLIRKATLKTLLMGHR